MLFLYLKTKLIICAFHVMEKIKFYHESSIIVWDNIVLLPLWKSSCLIHVYCSKQEHVFWNCTIKTVLSVINSNCKCHQINQEKSWRLTFFTRNQWNGHLKKKTFNWGYGLSCLSLLSKIFPFKYKAVSEAPKPCI